MNAIIESCHYHLSQMNNEDLSRFVLQSLIPDLKSPASLCRDGFLAETIILVDVLNVIQNTDFRHVIWIASLFDRFKKHLNIEGPFPPYEGGPFPPAPSPTPYKGGPSRIDKIDECVSVFREMAKVFPSITFILIAGDRLETGAVNMISRPLPRRQNLLLMNIVGNGGQKMETDDHLLLYLKAVFSTDVDRKIGFLSGDWFQNFPRSLRPKKKHGRLSLQFSIDNRGIPSFQFIPFITSIALVDPILYENVDSIPAMCYSLALIGDELMTGDLMSQTSLRYYITLTQSDPSRLRFFLRLVILLGQKISLCIPSYPLSVEYTRLYQGILTDIKEIMDTTQINNEFRIALETAMRHKVKRTDTITERDSKRVRR